MANSDKGIGFEYYLKSSQKSFKIFALEKVIKEGCSDSEFEIIQSLKQTEKDPGCLALIEQVLAAKAHFKEQANTIQSKKDFLAKWYESDQHNRIKLIDSVSVNLMSDLKELSAELYKSEKSENVRAKLIKTFFRKWPEIVYSNIYQDIDSENLVLRLAAVRALMICRPTVLLGRLPELLSSDDPQIKAYAIRALVKIDPAEATRHLQALVLSSNYTERVAGLQNCPFIPYELVQPVLLNFCAAESNYELIEKAGLLLATNPDIRVPYKLYEIAENSPGKKSEQILKILIESVKMLKESKILEDNFKIYYKKLQAWINKKRHFSAIRRAITVCNKSKDIAEFEKFIVDNLYKREFIDILGLAIKWPVSDDIKKVISFYLNKQDNIAIKDENSEEVSSSKEKDIKQIATFSDFNNLSLQKRLEFVKSIELDDNDSLTELLKQIVSCDKTDSQIKIIGLTKLTEKRCSGLESLAADLMLDKDASIAAPAIKYLALIDPEAVFPYIGKFLGVRDARIKSEAINVLKNFDFNQALATIDLMLKSKDLKECYMAIDFLDKFEFELIRNILTDFIINCEDSALADAAISHFAANPSIDNCYELYRIEKLARPEITSKARHIRLNCSFDFAEATNHQKATEKYLKERFENELASSKKAYSYKASSSLKKGVKSQKVSLSFADLMANALPWAKIVFIVLAFFVLAWLGIWLFDFLFATSAPVSPRVAGAPARIEIKKDIPEINQGQSLIVTVESYSSLNQSYSCRTREGAEILLRTSSKPALNRIIELVVDDIWISPAGVVVVRSDAINELSLSETE